MKKIKLQIIALMVVVGFLRFVGSAFAAPAEKKDDAEAKKTANS